MRLLLSPVVWVMVLAGPTLRAAVHEAWVHRYSNPVSNANDRAVKVICDAAGDIIVTGYTDNRTAQDMMTIKYSRADGSALWQRRTTETIPTALAVDAGDNVVVAGYSGRSPTFDMHTAKYTAGGALLWERRYNGPANGDDRVLALAVDPSGNVVVTGISGSSSMDLASDYYTAKYAAANGTLLWEKRYNGDANSSDVARAIAVDDRGDVLVTGDSLDGVGNRDLYTVKYAATDGTLLWEKRYDGSGNFTDEAHAVALDASGNVVVTGQSWNGSSSDLYTAKYAADNGDMLWERRYPVGFGYAIAIDATGNVVVTGSSYAISGNPDFITIKYAANGAIMWERPYVGPTNSGDWATAVTVDSGGNVAVTGYSGTAFRNDFYSAKYGATDGALIWQKRYNGPADREDRGQAITVDRSDNVIVTGYSIGSGIWPDFYTAKYAATDGMQLWETRYDGPTAYDDQAQAAAVDANGDIVVTGFSHSGGADDEDFYTAKYAAGDGALLWERRYNGPGNHHDRAVAVALDAAGNVAVTGFSREINEYADYYTAKYAGATGALLWDRRYNGPGNRNDQPTALAFDGSGNVLVTGFSWNGTNDDYYTAKYAATDGALLWEKRYNGPSNGYDGARAIAVDLSGNVVVTGTSGGGGYTAKYAGTDGILVWEHRSTNALPYALALDSSGNVIVTGGPAMYYTAKYASADGVLLWERRYIGPTARHFNVPRAVAVDSNDNVVVTGFSEDTWTEDRDYYTAKYAAQDGALLWERRYDARDDEAVAIAVDATGNVVVTGYSGGYLAFDFYTAKYAATNGALLWEKCYNGPANGDDQPLTSRSLALGPGGTVVVTGRSDVISGFAASYDYVTVKYVESPMITPLSEQGYHLKFPSNPGRRYAVQRAGSPAGPWTNLFSGNVPSDGYIVHADANPPLGAAFYRLAYP